MKYNGELNDKMKGFYRSKYTTPDGQERYCAVTQFEVRGFQKMIFAIKLNLILFFNCFRQQMQEEHFLVGMNQQSRPHLISQ